MEAAARIAIKECPKEWEKWKECNIEPPEIRKADLRKVADTPTEAELLSKSEAIAKERGITREQAMADFLNTREGIELHKKYVHEIRNKQ